MTGRILHINVSPGGVPKWPVPEALVTPLGLAGDGHAHPQIHGGPDTAILLICAEAIDALIVQGYPLFYGALGENITTRGLDRRLLRAGQRFRAGDAVLELVKLRSPCSTLDVYGETLGAALYDKACKAGDPTSRRWAMGGFYARVVETGVVRPGDPIVLIEMEA